MENESSFFNSDVSRGDGYLAALQSIHRVSFDFQDNARNGPNTVVHALKAFH